MGMLREEPMRLDVVSEFPYKHSTGETIGRFLAGLKEKQIWGQRVAGLGVVVPPVGYSEADGSVAGAWVEVKPTGVVTADLEGLRVGSRVEAVWRPDGEREGHVRDIATFRVIR